MSNDHNMAITSTAPVPEGSDCISREGKPISLPVPDTDRPPDLVKKIGKTTYIVRVHFSETSKETMSDKIKRMLRNEVTQMMENK